MDSDTLGFKSQTDFFLKVSLGSPCLSFLPLRYPIEEVGQYKVSPYSVLTRVVPEVTKTRW